VLGLVVGAPRPPLLVPGLDRWFPGLRRSLGDRYGAAAAEGRERTTEELLDDTGDRCPPVDDPRPAERLGLI
jgi:hypothetical protein